LLVGHDRVAWPADAMMDDFAKPHGPGSRARPASVDPEDNVGAGQAACIGSFHDDRHAITHPAGVQ